MRLKYKTEYLVMVTEIIHAYPDIKVGDLIVLKCMNGYSTNGGLGLLGGGYFYSIGDVDYFKIDHNMTYLDLFYMGQSSYQDTYCYHCFSLYFGNKEYINEFRDKIMFVKEFFENYMHDVKK